jgi:hypothetical protein
VAWSARTALRRSLILAAALGAIVVGQVIGFAVRGGAATPPSHTLVCVHGVHTVVNGSQSCGFSGGSWVTIAAWLLVIAIVAAVVVFGVVRHVIRPRREVSGA